MKGSFLALTIVVIQLIDLSQVEMLTATIADSSISLPGVDWANKMFVHMVGTWNLLGDELMTAEATIQKTLVEQVFDEMFTSIEGREEFDTLTIQKLKQLAMSGDLAKATQVTKAIRVAS